jgi:hypothetical protein
VRRKEVKELRNSVKRLLVLALSATFLVSVMECAPVKAPPGGRVLVVPTMFPTLALAVAASLPNDEIHVLNGYTEVLVANLVIPTPNLWIIGAPPQLGPAPIIILNGFTIVVAGFNVFIWGLIIFGGGSAVGIQLVPPSSNCMIWNNTIEGTGPTPVVTGIQVLTVNNTVVLNTMMNCVRCIDLAGAACVNNVVKGNTLNPPYGVGIQVSGGAGLNYVYWNNLMAPNELVDTNPPGSPPNFFDDTTGGGPGLNKGNFEITHVPGSGPYHVPGLNGYVDNFPLNSPWTQIPGDIDVNGRVGLSDLVMLANSYGKAWCNLLWDPRCVLAAPWGAIGLSDLVTLAKNYGKADP